MLPQPVLIITTMNHNLSLTLTKVLFLDLLFPFNKSIACHCHSVTLMHHNIITLAVIFGC